MCDAKKACSEIVISLGGACEEKKKKNTGKMMPLFFLGIFVLFEMNVLALFGQDSLCLCTHRERNQESTLRSSTGTMPSHVARLHEAADSSAPTSLPA